MFKIQVGNNVHGYSFKQLYETFFTVMFQVEPRWRQWGYWGAVECLGGVVSDGVKRGRRVGRRQIESEKRFPLVNSRPNLSFFVNFAEVLKCLLLLTSLRTIQTVYFTLTFLSCELTTATFHARTALAQLTPQCSVGDGLQLTLMEAISCSTMGSRACYQTEQLFT